MQEICPQDLRRKDVRDMKRAESMDLTKLLALSLEVKHTPTHTHPVISLVLKEQQRISYPHGQPYFTSK